MRRVAAKLACCIDSLTNACPAVRLLALLLAALALAPATASAGTPGTVCCTINGVCFIDSSPNCTSQPIAFPAGGGAFTCSPNPCRQPYACCFDNGTCTVINGYTGCPGYTPAGGVCSASSCVGACCLSTTGGYGCSITKPGDCASGNFQGLGTTCSPEPCPIGACCGTFGCIQTDQRACPGTFIGVGVACSPDPCPPPPIDCVVSDWSDWGGCSVPCGGGIEIRRRTIITPAANGGAACPVLEESRPCNTLPCPVVCCAGDGACTFIAPPCPPGSTQSTATTCTPNSCPQPVACCSPCGACSVAVAGSSCPAGTTALPGVRSCSPVNPCPGAGVTVSAALAVSGWVAAIPGFPGSFSFSNGPLSTGVNGNTGRGFAEFNLSSLPTGVPIQSAWLEIQARPSNLTGGPGVFPSVAALLGYAGDGSIDGNEYDFGDAIGQFTASDPQPVRIDVTASVLARLSAGEAIAGFAVRLISSPEDFTIWEPPTLRITVLSSKVCCDPAGGACTTVGFDQCCPQGTNLLPGALSCSPTPCPQPILCCNPCGACAVVAANATCPAGSTEIGRGTTCPPVNSCPSAGVTVSPALAVSGWVAAIPGFPGSFSFSNGPLNTGVNGNTGRGFAEFNLSSLPTGVPIQSAWLEIQARPSILTGGPGAYPSTAALLGYAGDGSIDGNEFDFGDAIGQFTASDPQPVRIDVTASVLARLSAGEAIAGFAVRLISSPESFTVWEPPTLRIQLRSSKVCCDPQSGVCTTVAADECCPAGSALLAGAVVCAPNPCPQPPVDCVVSDWSDWSTCTVTCGGGIQTRTRTVITPAANGGAPCPVLEETRACNTQPCPVDCVVSDWSDWSTCTVTCGGGAQTRTRTIITPAANGGAPCPALEETRACNTQPCAVVCCAGDGSCTFIAPPCPPGSTQSTATTCTPNSCPQPVACCSPCGACTVVLPGSSCPDGTSPLTGVTSCSPVNPCPAAGTASSIDPALVGSTSFDTYGGPTLITTFNDLAAIAEFNLGSLPAGVSVRSASLELVVPGTTAAQALSLSLRGYPGNGALTDGDYNAGDELLTFTYPAPATRTVDVTQSIRERLTAGNEYAGFNIKVTSSGGAVTFTSARLLLELVTSKVCCAPSTGVCSLVAADQCCPSGTNQLAGALTCSPNPCPVDCIVSDWSDWGTCSVACGAGTQTRTRTVITPAANGGAPCPVLEETRACNTDPCTVACCDPCGVCTVVLVSVGCPSGTNTSMSSSCGPTTCPVPTFTIAALAPEGHGSMTVFYFLNIADEDPTGSVSSSRSANMFSEQSSVNRKERVMRVRATPAAGWRFKEWSSGTPCTPQNTTINTFGVATCSYDRSCTETGPSFFQPIFERVPSTVQVTVTGPGTVNSDPSGIQSCTPTSGTCSAPFPVSTTVTLTATPDANSWFTGWSSSIPGGGDPPANLNRQLVLNLPDTSTTVNVAAGFVGNRPPVARCRPVVIDARAACPGSFTISASDVDNGSSDPDAPLGDSIIISINDDGPFPVGLTTVTLTVRDSLGETASCETSVLVLGQDCNSNGLPDVCECFYDNTPSQPVVSVANAQVSQIGGGSPGGTRVADDFTLCEGQIHRITGFRGSMLTSAVVGLRKARLDFYEDCGGAPAATPFASYKNSAIESEIPFNSDLALVSYFFDLCDPAAGLVTPPAPGRPAEGLWLEGGRTYWVSLTGLPMTESDTTTLSYWVAAPPVLPLIGASPYKADGTLMALPASFEGINWQPWQNLAECCVGCANMDFSLAGFSCFLAWDNRDVATPAAGLPSGTAAPGSEAVAADNFILPPCEPKQLCMIEAYIWTNCAQPRGFIDIYPNDCATPGVDPIRFVEGVTATDMQTTGTINGIELRLYRLRVQPGGVSLPAGTYWLSAGTLNSGSLQERTFFAAAPGQCTPDCKVRISPAVSRPVVGGTDPIWTGATFDLSFRIFTRDRPFFMPVGDDGGSQPGTPADNNPCRIDVDRNGTVNIDDLFNYLNIWFRGC